MCVPHSIVVTHIYKNITCCSAEILTDLVILYFYLLNLAPKDHHCCCPVSCPNTICLCCSSLSHISNSLKYFQFPQHTFISLCLCLLLFPQPRVPFPVHLYIEEIQFIHESPAQISVKPSLSLPVKFNCFFTFAPIALFTCGVIHTSFSLTFFISCLYAFLFHWSFKLSTPQFFISSSKPNKHSILNRENKEHFPVSIGLDHNVLI